MSLFYAIGWLLHAVGWLAGRRECGLGAHGGSWAVMSNACVSRPSGLSEERQQNNTVACLLLELLLLLSACCCRAAALWRLPCS